MRILWAAVLMAAAIAAPGWGQGTIRLKTRNISPAQASGPVRRQTAPGAARHFLVLFRNYPGADVRAELQRRRVAVLAFVPDTALMVAARSLNLAGMDVLWSGVLEPGDKLSPALAQQAGGAYLVIFHSDTEDAVARQLLRQRGYTVVENPALLPAQYLVTGAASGLAALATADPIAYILPASVDLETVQPVMGCTGALAEAGPLAEYALATGAWNRDASGAVALRYFLESLTEKLDAATARSEITRALTEWARYAKLTFNAAPQAFAARSVDVQFVRGAHGDTFPFAGTGILAHTFYPAPLNPEPVAGDIHFNADQAWRAGASIDLFTVALHETGHALGLGHSDHPGDVMYPYYHMSAGLAPGDIAAIQTLYGAAAGGGGSGSGGGSSGGGGSGSGGAGSTGKSTNAPSITIVSPGATIVSTSAASITFSGTAGGAVAVKWTTSNGDSGDGQGTTSWTATIPLFKGTNAVTVRAYDASGGSSWRAVTVVRY